MSGALINFPSLSLNDFKLTFSLFGLSCTLVFVSFARGNRLVLKQLGLLKRQSAYRFRSQYQIQPCHARADLRCVDVGVNHRRFDVGMSHYFL